MELEKGKCFCCSKTEIISIPPKTEIQKILFCLFTEKIFNINALKEYTSLLRLCPSCLHKLILLREASKQIKSNEGTEKGSNTCLLCGKEGFCIKVSDSWNHFKEISEDYSLFANTSKIIMCSGCIFYLDTRNTMKMKLCSEYPQLKEVPILKFKLKEVNTQSTPISEKKMNKRKTREASVEIINLSSDSNVSSIDLSPLKGLTTLKYEELLKKPKSISSDSKFMNQILYIKMNKHDFPSSTNINQDKNKRSQGSKLTNKRRNMNTRRLSVTLHNGTSANIEHKSGSDAMSPPNKYSRIKSNADDRDTSRSLSKERNSFFKIKLKKNTKSSQTINKQSAHKKKYMQFMEPDFNRKLIINILRYDVETYQSSNVDDLSTGKLDARERSNTDSSMESLLIVVDEVDDETTPDDIEKPENNSNPDTEKKEQEKLDSNDTETNDEEAIEISSNENDKEESKEKCETITNESQKDLIGKDVVSEDTDSDITVSNEEIEKAIREKESNEVDCVEKEPKIAVKNIDSDENHVHDDDVSKGNSTVETDDQCTEEIISKEEFKDIEDGGPSNTTEGSEGNGDIREDETDSISGNNDKEKVDLTNEDKDQTNDTDNSEVNEIEEEIGGNNEKKKDDSNDEDKDQAKDTDMDKSDVNDINDDLKDADINNREENNTDGCLKGDVDNSSKEIEDDLNYEYDNFNDDKVDVDPDSKDMQNTSEMESRISNEEYIERSSPSEMLEDTNTEDNDQISGCNKRKCNDSTEDASSPDRKKKKVTFSDVVLESID